jgi:tetratricopeptide (TPR) repeat protein
MEFWWVSAFCLITAAEALHARGNVHTFYDHCALTATASALILSTFLLLQFIQAGRLACFVLLGVQALDHLSQLFIGQRSGSVCLHAAYPLACIWMIVYLQCPSTARLCTAARKKRGAKEPALSRTQYSVTLLDAVELGLGVITAVLARATGAELGMAASAGVATYAIYSLVLEDAFRRKWQRWFPSTERGYPASEMFQWREACRALADNDFESVRFHVAMFSNEALAMPATRLLSAVTDWTELTDDSPSEGQASLRRLILDHDFKPTLIHSKTMTTFIAASNREKLRGLIDDRTALIDMLVAAGLNPESQFHNQADSVLTRLTGQAFAFNPADNWAAWWQDHRDDWTGDTGAVSIVARLIRVDCDTAADALAAKMGGASEEPLLRELAAQVLFLNGMQRALREKDPVDTFFRQPQRLLLYPECTDAFGLLHADSHVLENLGMPVRKVARRLMQRVLLVDYISDLWTRYPTELHLDLPWILKTLTGRSFGRLRARDVFQKWWPTVRESYLRHDRAFCAGLTAIADNKDVEAEKHFRTALAEHPKELSSRYNLVLCLMQRQAHGEAAQLLQELTQLEPKESYWWLVLGEMHRNTNQSADAHAAFRRALELGAHPPKVALHIGLTFARDRRYSEAISHLDRVLGTNPSPSKIEALVSQLENEGLWNLAGHYREEAFRRGLKVEGGDEIDGDMIA